MSSTQEQPQVQVQRDRRPDNQGYVKLIVAAVIVILLLFYIFQNRVKVPFTFLFLDVKWPLWLILVVTLVIGFLIGMIVSALLRRRKKRELRRRAGSI